MREDEFGGVYMLFTVFIFFGSGASWGTGMLRYAALGNVRGRRSILKMVKGLR